MNAAERAKKGALVIALEDRGTLIVSGADRKSWLNGLLTCDLNQVREGAGALSLALTKQGKIQSDVLVVDAGETIALGVALDVAPALRDTLDRHLVMEDAEIVDRTSELAWLALHGPRAVELARTSAAERGFASAALELTQPGDAVMVVPRSELGAATARLVELGGEGVAEASAEDWLTLRLGRALGAFGVDYGPLDNPHEAGLDRRAVSWTKGCYLGQEVVCMQDMRGKVKRRLSLIEIESDRAPSSGSAVAAAEGAEAAGEITSAALVEPARALALAKLKAPFFEPGARLLVEGKGARVLPAGEVESGAR